MDDPRNTEKQGLEGHRAPPVLEEGGRGIGDTGASFLLGGSRELLGGLAGSGDTMSMYEKIAHECVRKKDERGDQVTLPLSRSLSLPLPPSPPHPPPSSLPP